MFANSRRRNKYRIRSRILLPYLWEMVQFFARKYSKNISLINSVEFNNSHCLMLSEVNLLLREVEDRRREEMVRLPNLPGPSPSLIETMDYVQKLSQYSHSPELVKTIRKYYKTT